MLQTISSPLCDPLPYNGETTIKLSINVTIARNGNYAFSRYTNHTGDYITVNPKARLVIQYSEKGMEWDKHNQIVLTQRNIFQMKVGIERFYKLFQREDLYTYDNSGCVATMHCKRENLVVISLGFNQFIRFLPDIVTDRTNIRYPGVQVTMNHEENKVLLSIEEFECMYHILRTTDISAMGLSLIQTYATMQKHSVMDNVNEIERRKSTPVDTGAKSIYESKKGVEQCSGPPLIRHPKTLDDV